MKLLRTWSTASCSCVRLSPIATSASADCKSIDPTLNGARRRSAQLGQDALKLTHDTVLTPCNYCPGPRRDGGMNSGPTNSGPLRNSWSHWKVNTLLSIEDLPEDATGIVSLDFKPSHLPTLCSCAISNSALISRLSLRFHLVPRSTAPEKPQWPLLRRSHHRQAARFHRVPCRFPCCPTASVPRRSRSRRCNGGLRRMLRRQA